METTAPEGWRSVDYFPEDLPAKIELGDGERSGVMTATPGLNFRHAIHLLLNKSKAGETPFPLLYWRPA